VKDKYDIFLDTLCNIILPVAAGRLGGDDASVHSACVHHGLLLHHDGGHHLEKAGNRRGNLFQRQRRLSKIVFRMEHFFCFPVEASTYIACFWLIIVVVF
jgi:hypothetical protein